MAYDHVDEPAKLLRQGEPSEREHRLILGAGGRLRRHGATLGALAG